MRLIILVIMGRLVALLNPIIIFGDSIILIVLGGGVLVILSQV